MKEKESDENLKDEIDTEIKKYAEFDLSLNVLDIVAIIIAILAICISIFLATHTFINRDVNESALEELKAIRKLLEDNSNNLENNSEDNSNYAPKVNFINTS